MNSLFFLDSLSWGDHFSHACVKNTIAAGMNLEIKNVLVATALHFTTKSATKQMPRERKNQEASSAQNFKEMWNVCRRTGLHGLAECMMDNDRFRSDSSSSLHQRSFFRFRQQLMKSLTSHVDGCGFGLQSNQQLVGVARRRYASLRQSTSLRQRL